MPLDTLANLGEKATYHKREMRRHRRELQVVVRTIEEFKRQMAALGIQEGAAIGDVSHGPKQQNPGT